MSRLFYQGGKKLIGVQQVIARRKNANYTKKTYKFIKNSTNFNATEDSTS